MERRRNLEIYNDQSLPSDNLCRGNAPYCFQRGNESIRRSNYFCWVCDDQNKKVEIYGKSESLKMGPKESDQIAIEVFLSGYTELDLINIMALFALKEIPR